jgi:hypothetical protein
MATDNLFQGVMISVLAQGLEDIYISLQSAKELWNALEDKYGISNAGSELYVLELFTDYKMVYDRLVVEQAHEIQSLAKELEG